MRKKNQGILGLLIIGGVFIGIGLALVLFMGKDTYLDCSRSSSLCSIYTKDVFNKIEQVKNFDLATLNEARIVELCSTSKKGCKSKTYKTMLVTTKGVFPLTSVSSSDKSSHTEQVNRINSFIQSTQDRLELMDSGNIARMVGYIFVTVGFLIDRKSVV